MSACRHRKPLVIEQGTGPNSVQLHPLPPASVQALRRLPPTQQVYFEKEPTASVRTESSQSHPPTCKTSCAMTSSHPRTCTRSLPYSGTRRVLEPQGVKHTCALPPAKSNLHGAVPRPPKVRTKGNGEPSLVLGSSSHGSEKESERPRRHGTKSDARKIKHRHAAQRGRHAWDLARGLPAPCTTVHTRYTDGIAHTRHTRHIHSTHATHKVHAGAHRSAHATTTSTQPTCCTRRWCRSGTV